ncbi:MAG: folate family ECF transporter S component [Clostridia bacterium]|nr:folate family ECF transporter S component [Clostridia bacterium]
MSKTTQQEIATPESASNIAETIDVADTESQKTKKKTISEKGREYFSSRNIARLATFVALALVMKLIGKSLTLTPTFTVTFIYLPWLISGAVLGPIGGMIVGAISDVLGNLIFGQPFIPLTFVSNMLYPVFIGIIYKTPIKNDYVKCGIGAVCSLLFCTLGLGSLALYTFYGYIETMSFFEYLIAFRLQQVIVFAVNLVLLLALIRPLQNVGLFPKPTESRISKIAIFAVTAGVITASVITALIIMIVNGVVNAVAYALLAELHASLILLSAFIITGKTKISAILLIGFIVAICSFAITATSSSPNIIIEIKYVLSILVGVISVGLIALIAIRGLRKTRS